MLKFKAFFRRCGLYLYPQNTMKDVKTTTELHVLRVTHGTVNTRKKKILNALPEDIQSIPKNQTSNILCAIAIGHTQGNLST